MKKLLIVFTCLSLVASANAALLLSDDFEGDLSSWTMLQGTAWQIVDVNGDNMAAAGSADFSRMEKALSGTLDDVIIVEFDGSQLSGSNRHQTVYLTNASGVGIGINHSSGAGTGDLSTGIIKTTTNGTDWGFDSVASGVILAGPAFSYGIVRSFKLVFNRVTGDVEAWGEGSLIASTTLDAGLLATVANPTKVVTWQKSGWGSMGLDDLNITTIPEPATMALLAFGGLGVLIRRRR